MLGGKGCPEDIDSWLLYRDEERLLPNVRVYLQIGGIRKDLEGLRAFFEVDGKADLPVIVVEINLLISQKDIHNKTAREATDPSKMKLVDSGFWDCENLLPTCCFFSIGCPVVKGDKSDSCFGDADLGQVLGIDPLPLIPLEEVIGSALGRKGGKKAKGTGAEK